jgi:hypothetical protein
MPSGILIPDSEIKSSSGGPVTIDTITVSAVTIPNVELKDFKGVFSYASSTAKNVEIVMQLSIDSTFHGCVSICWPICCQSVSGGLNIANFTQTTPLGDIAMEGGSFCMQVPDTKFGPFSMTIPPLGNGTKTTVAKIQVTDICMHCTEVPMPNPLGITLGDSFPVPNPMGPMNVKIKETTMKELDSTGIATPAATVKNIKALNISIPSVTTKPINIVTSTAMTVGPISMPLYNDGSALGKKVTTSGCGTRSKIESCTTLNVSSVTLHIKGGLEFTNVQGNVTTSSADSGAFDLDLNLKGLKIKGLSILGLKMPELEVEL